MSGADQPVEPPPIRIVISYRRQDSPGGAHRLRDSLARRFGRENVFLDIDSIPPGVDWVEAIRQTVSECDVLLPAIGLHWLTATDERGQRRLDNENDILRFEIETALAMGLRVIPIQLHGAHMPRPDELPPSLSGLTRRQSIRVDDEDWEHDIGKIIRALETIQEQKAEAVRADEQAEQERLAREQAERERRALDQAEQERLAREEPELRAREQAERESAAREQAEQERLARERAEQERLAHEKAERIAREEAERETLPAEEAERQRPAKEQADQERIARAGVGTFEGRLAGITGHDPLSVRRFAVLAAGASLLFVITFLPWVVRTTDTDPPTGFDSLFVIDRSGVRPWDLGYGFAGALYVILVILIASSMVSRMKLPSSLVSPWYLLVVGVVATLGYSVSVLTLATEHDLPGWIGLSLALSSVIAAAAWRMGSVRQVTAVAGAAILAFLVAYAVLGSYPWDGTLRTIWGLLGVALSVGIALGVWMQVAAARLESKRDATRRGSGLAFRHAR